MNTALWIAQCLLAALFAGAGLLKVTADKPTVIAKAGPWAADFSERTITLIGWAEIAASLGLVVPGLVGVAVVLTPLAALGVVLLMLGAATTHGRRREPGRVVFCSLLLVVASFVAYGRLGL